ncbi:MAG: HAMP domain-containing sensor histidine kinase, partial [Patescibacteria group bacterium]|nr:HAMP domain-containing sensor histidine kinase [Patescibacteria group bacterium]
TVKEAYEVEKNAHSELKRLDEAKTQFIMATQHHLRTPLTSMIGYLDLIFGGIYGKVPSELRKTLKKFEISTSRLIKVVNELLDISQFQLGKKIVILKDGIDIEPILKEIMEELEVETKTKKIYLKLVKPRKTLPLVKADPEKLKVAITNIIDNGVKYTEKGGVTIELKHQTSNVKSGVQLKTKLQIIVKDTGMGIANKDLKTLFSRTFERGEKAKQVYTTGRGIGLYITYQIIKAHNGKIWAESEGRNKGTSFYIELPVD